MDTSALRITPIISSSVITSSSTISPTSPLLTATGLQQSKSSVAAPGPTASNKGVPTIISTPAFNPTATATQRAGKSEVVSNTIAPGRSTAASQPIREEVTSKTPTVMPSSRVVHTKPVSPDDLEFLFGYLALAQKTTETILSRARGCPQKRSFILRIKHGGRLLSF